jgi:hypothetical protein
MSKPLSDKPGNRNNGDRRSHDFRSFLHSLYKRRRRGMRRAEDHKTSHYVDIYDKATVIAAITVIFLSCTDSLLTLLLISEGRATEANPVMRILIESDTTLFVAAKAALTILCLLFLIAHKNFWLFNKRLHGKYLLFGTFIGYASLINYELILLNV